MESTVCTSLLQLNCRDVKYVSLMSKIRNKDQWAAKKFERHIFETVTKDIIREQKITTVECWHDKASAFNSLPFLTYLLDDFHAMCVAANPDYTTTATHCFEGGHGRHWADRAIANHKVLHKWLQATRKEGFTSNLIEMRQLLANEFKRRTDGDQIRLFERKCSGEFLVWDADELTTKPPHEMQLRVFKFRNLSATFHQRRITANGQDKIEQFAFSEDGTDKSGFREHNQLPGLPVPFEKVAWKDRSEDINRHLNPAAESINTTFHLSDKVDGAAQNKRHKLQDAIQLRQNVLQDQNYLSQHTSQLQVFRKLRQDVQLRQHTSPRSTAYPF